MMVLDFGFLVDEFLCEYDVCFRGLAYFVVSREGGGDGFGGEDVLCLFEDMFCDVVKNMFVELLLLCWELKFLWCVMNIVGGGLLFTFFGVVFVSGFALFRLLK